MKAKIPSSVIPERYKSDLDSLGPINYEGDSELLIDGESVNFEGREKEERVEVEIEDGSVRGILKDPDNWIQECKSYTGLRKIGISSGQLADLVGYSESTIRSKARVGEVPDSIFEKFDSDPERISWTGLSYTIPFRREEESGYDYTWVENIVDMYLNRDIETLKEIRKLAKNRQLLFKLSDNIAYEGEKKLEYLELIIDQKNDKIEEKEKGIEKLEERWEKTVSGSIRDFGIKIEETGKLLTTLTDFLRKDFLTEEQEKKFLSKFGYLYEDVISHYEALQEEFDLEEDDDIPVLPTFK